MPSNSNRSKLPEQCYAVREDDSALILIKRGESGYYTTAFSTQNGEANRALANKLNAKLGVSQEQEQAMRFGSLFGWNLPGANPDFYAANQSATTPAHEFTEDERAYSLNDGESYLLIQTYEDGYDYTIYFYDFSEFDGGQYDDTSITMDKAVQLILEEYGLHEHSRAEYDIDDLRAKTDEVAQARYEAALAKVQSAALDTRLNSARERSAQQQENPERTQTGKGRDQRE